MKKASKVIIFLSVIIISLILYFWNSSEQNEYDLEESEILKDKIVWNAQTKLKWTNFKYDENEKSFTTHTKVGLSARYNVHQPILFRSYTLFIPDGSIASDTTNPINLRIAQAKFDLLETYRRKMEKEVDSFRRSKSEDILTSDFDKMTDRYYQDFEKEWESYKRFTDDQFLKLEESIKNRLK